jgi:hypothetical protein
VLVAASWLASGAIDVEVFGDICAGNIAALLFGRGLVEMLFGSTRIVETLEV